MSVALRRPARPANSIFSDTRRARLKRSTIRCPAAVLHRRATKGAPRQSVEPAPSEDSDDGIASPRRRITSPMRSARDINSSELCMAIREP